MKTVFEGKKVSGILSLLPQTECKVEDSLIDSEEKRVRRLKRIMGFDKRRCVKETTNISDMHIYSLKYLLEKGYIKKDEIGAIVTASTSPDFYIPTLSNIIHGECDLPQDVFCVDIPQGCSGYVVGLMEAFSLLDYMPDQKVLLFTGDILNRGAYNTGKVLKNPVFGGDAASVSIVENDSDYEKSYYEYFSDGISGKELCMYAGAFKHPLYTPSDVMVELGDGTIVNGLSVDMDGSGVFNFIQKRVPDLIKDTLQFAQLTDEDIDYYIFHQPNRFILQKLADNLDVAYEKMPMETTEKYGNSNSSTIPVTIADKLADKFMKERKKCCLSGFGSGLTWCSLILDMGKMDFCELLQTEF